MFATSLGEKFCHCDPKTTADLLNGVNRKLTSARPCILQRRIWDVAQHCQLKKCEASIIHQFLNPIHRIHTPNLTFVN
jgi:hypothetical protein